MEKTSAAQACSCGMENMIYHSECFIIIWYPCLVILMHIWYTYITIYYEILNCIVWYGKLWHINLNGITSNCIRSKLIKMGIWYTIMIKILNDIVLYQIISNITLHNVIASAVDIVGKINMQIWYQIRLSYNMSKSFTSHRREASFAWRLEGCSFANKSVSNQRHFPMYRNSSPHCATPLP